MSGDFQIIYSDPRPQGVTPHVPPVANLRDADGVLITLDCDVICDHLGLGGSRRARCFNSPRRARVVGIGDGGLPGRAFLKTREYGSTYVGSAGHDKVIVHQFDEVAWLQAETSAAAFLSDRKIDLTKCMFGGFYFEEYQKLAAWFYLEGRTDEIGGTVPKRYDWWRKW